VPRVSFRHIERVASRAKPRRAWPFGVQILPDPPGAIWLEPKQGADLLRRAAVTLH
jgi:hypothetical protein